MYPQLVIAQYGQYLAAMYVASLFNPAAYGADPLFLYSPPARAPGRTTIRVQDG